MKPKLSHQELKRLLEKVEHDIETAQKYTQVSVTDLKAAQKRIDQAKKKHADALLNESLLFKTRDIIKYQMAYNMFEKEDN